MVYLWMVVTGEFPAQRDSNDAENVSIWWHHHVYCSTNIYTRWSSRRLRTWVSCSCATYLYDFNQTLLIASVSRPSYFREHCPYHIRLWIWLKSRVLSATDNIWWHHHVYCSTNIYTRWSSRRLRTWVSCSCATYLYDFNQTLLIASVSRPSYFREHCPYHIRLWIWLKSMVLSATDNNLVVSVSDPCMCKRTIRSVNELPIHGPTGWKL